MTKAHRSSYKIVEAVDSWPYFDDDPEGYKKFMQDYFAFLIDGIGEPIGLVHVSVIEALPWPECWTVDAPKRLITLHCLPNFEVRTLAVEEAMLKGHAANASPSLSIWHNERFPVYSADGQHVLDVDGSGVDVIGARSFAVYLTAWTNTPGGRKYWVQRRGWNKTLLPGMLDSAVSGRLKPGELPYEGMVREAGEEANLPEALLRERLRPCDVLAAAYTTSNQGAPAYMHHTQYVYEIELDQEHVLSCDTDEVAEFFLMSLEEVRDAIDRDEFIPITRLVYLAHFIRHGVITADNDARLQETCARLHRRPRLYLPG
ncbi:NUDIX hydrolase domain-like protein [Cercophora newfieldiana]|uniref:NUDIX hydrolase domain-like protein n=1 Tax=Cercophora newfieldiana TaxID=92897 RepID=A0AA39Y3A8_9PEZI|nr:NUDIX hydrolase domain-like protein [Cercophora newfieldiana]